MSETMIARPSFAARPSWRRARLGHVLTATTLVICLVLGFALRAQWASSPSAHRSADDRAYGRIALALSSGGSYGDSEMNDPYQWAPGAPAMFALARELGGGSVAPGYRIEAAYWAQALVGTLAIAVAFLLTAATAGSARGRAAAAVAGVAAACAAAFYPPLVAASGSQLSEPLGALLLLAACAALAAARTRRRAVSLALCGALLGAAVLARADLLL
ncbi:MAG: hypothetical protein QOE11_526, partial [Solirubrobacteraceae bacterium]|nr:hypothetical protein [Solirubrobacteraceae bacterium]